MLFIVVVAKQNREAIENGAEYSFSGSSRTTKFVTHNVQPSTSTSVSKHKQNDVKFDRIACRRWKLQGQLAAIESLAVNLPNPNTLTRTFILP